jgi:hypothetical protein
VILTSEFETGKGTQPHREARAKRLSRLSFIVACAVNRDTFGTLFNALTTNPLN